MQLDDDEEGKGGETRLNRRDSVARVKYRGNVMSKTRVMYMIEKPRNRWSQKSLMTRFFPVSFTKSNF